MEKLRRIKKLVPSCGLGEKREKDDFIVVIGGEPPPQTLSVGRTSHVDGEISTKLFTNDW